MKWEVDLHDDFVPECGELNKDVQDELLAHIGLLEQFGPRVGRPRVDTLNGSRHANMKELRFGAADGAWRFAFDSTQGAGRLSCVAVTSRAAAKDVSTAG